MSLLPVSARQFRYAHAAHPNWRLATELCLAQLEGQMRQPGYTARGTLGLLYITDHHVEVASEILTFLKIRTGVAHWVGTVGLGVLATGVEYFDEPALVVMLADLPLSSFSVFSGQSPMPGLGQRTVSGALAAHTVLVHADPATPELPELIQDLSDKVESGWVFGALSSSRHRAVQIADRTLQTDQVYGAGLSGVVFSSEVHLLTAVTQGCWPVLRAGVSVPYTSPAAHEITACEDQIIISLDQRPALDVLLEDLGVRDTQTASHLARLSNGLFVGLANSAEEITRGDYWVRQIVGLEPEQRFLVLAAPAATGQQLLFCTRDAEAARRDLIRICTDLREQIEHDASVRAEHVDAARGNSSRGIRGALYFSCTGRGSHLFGDTSTELQLIQKHLGDVPLIGLCAGGEIAHRRLYGYTGVLSVFI
jgi:small ligand-binding sensory domain FIST